MSNEQNSYYATNFPSERLAKLAETYDQGEGEELKRTAANYLKAGAVIFERYQPRKKILSKSIINEKYTQSASRFINAQIIIPEWISIDIMGYKHPLNLGDNYQLSKVDQECQKPIEMWTWNRDYEFDPNDIFQKLSMTVLEWSMAEGKKNSDIRLSKDLTLPASAALHIGRQVLKDLRDTYVQKEE